MFRFVAKGAPLADKNLAPDQPYYVSISSTPKHRSGKILTVGRISKNNTADLIFAKDAKAVSRNHLTLRLVKLGVPTPAGTPDADADGADEEAEGNAFDKPQNPDEMAACQEAADGIILVLHNSGSLGTSIEYEVPVAALTGEEEDDDKKKKPDGEDTDDDETDDEAGSQAAAKAASKAKPSAGSKTKLVQHRLEKGESFIVKSLSLPEEEEVASDSHLVCASAFSSLPTIRVGLGSPDMSTNFPKVFLEITRVPMNLCVTRIDAKSKSKLAKMADEVGVNVVHSKEGWFSHPSHPLLAYTHLLAPNVTPTAKSIAAWCLKKPIVDPNYVFKGLAERKTFWDPMPKESDYSPEAGKDIMTTEAAKAENIGKGPFMGRRDPLKGFVVISIAPGETESLVMAAGGTVFRAYDLDDDAFNSGTWLDELEAAQKNPIPTHRPSGASAGGTVVLIETSSKKVKKRRDFLRTRNIHAVAQKEFANSINEMKSVLNTTDGELVHGRENMPSSSFRLPWGSGDSGSDGAQSKASIPKAQAAPSPEESEAARLSTIQEVSREDESRNESSERPPAVDAKKAKRPPAVEPEPAKEPEPKPAKEREAEPEAEAMAEEPQAEDAAARGKRKRGGASNKDQGADADDNEAAEEPQKTTKRTKTGRSSKEDDKPREDEEDEIVAANSQDDDIPPTEEGATRSKRKRDEEESAGAEAETEAPADRPKKKRSGRKASKGHDDENQERIVKTTSNPNERRKPLPKAKKTGWLSAAPKDANERAKYKSTKADLDDIDATFPSEAAITVKKTGLVVRSNEEYHERRAQMMAARGRGPRVVTGRDGKPVKDFKRFRKNTVIRGSMGDIRFRSVLPKESERQRQLQQLERQLAEDTREADALFYGEEAGSITSFFGKSTAKKKKGSRSRVRR